MIGEFDYFEDKNGIHFTLVYFDVSVGFSDIP